MYMYIMVYYKVGFYFSLEIMWGMREKTERKGAFAKSAHVWMGACVYERHLCMTDMCV